MHKNPLNRQILYVMQKKGGGGNLFMPILLFPPLRFQNSKFGIGKNWEKDKNWQKT